MGEDLQPKRFVEVVALLVEVILVVACLGVTYAPEEMAAELRTTEQLLEGFSSVAVENIGPVALMVMSDSRERVRRALGDLAAE